MQSLGLFSDVFFHSMRYLQQQFETQRGAAAAAAAASSSSRHQQQHAHSNNTNPYSSSSFHQQLRRRSSSSSSSAAASLAMECVISRLLPGLLHPRLTVLSLRSIRSLFKPPIYRTYFFPISVGSTLSATPPTPEPSP